MLLLIPGPVTTRPEVRAAMAQDFAPWDNDFRILYADLRGRVRAISGGARETHSAIALQGCGHFATEASLRSFVPPGGRILVPATGQYAERMMRLAREAGRVPVPLAVPGNGTVQPEAVAAALAADPGIGHVGLVYSETSSGVVHDPAPVGKVVREAGRRMILDAVSAFGALPLDVAAMPELDAVAFTSNKCLEGMPGLSFSVVRLDRLEACAGQAGSWSFNLADVQAQYRRSGDGSFRFTPPAQVLASLRVALDLYDAEGGQAARLARYRENARVLYDGMVSLGLQPCLAWEVQGPIVVNVRAPADPAWSLQGFVDALKSRGFLISNFYNTAEPSFRVGCIGAVTPEDMQRFVAAADAALHALGIRNRAPVASAA
ncbi:2-aminoethylphosphonate--pyruvate transaminase [Rhodovastum atsumiense]|uniref:2-aminoethylphosphonate--pyruvate transaminase n=1 Tax=Rhodovastum atsumiense TaxID=504468 RepID=A0A5M6IYN3_9PROT|nr:2-aminoethylphosphonate--pyruvate transaminase [Rhodovastum atsumiense]KAA5612478.1 2-aminoethylphosphonate--pyruvate transaminase [Rhodovastum atsumiense]CAH2600395.1 2-aminoethylphosphonate--pyruvate transaminase [Rhodovastum atsumiense]